MSAAYIKIISNIAGVVAILPSDVKYNIIQMIDAQPVQRPRVTMSSIAFLATAVAFLLAILRRFSRRRVQIRNVPVNAVVSIPNTYNRRNVHAFVKTAILKAINEEQRMRLITEIDETKRLRRALSSLKGTHEKLRDTLAAATVRENHMKKIFKELKDTFQSVPAEITVMDLELKTLRRENDEAAAYIRELQNKSLKNTRNLAAATQNAYVQKQKTVELAQRLTLILNKT